jgi:hypothetical protein
VGRPIRTVGLSSTGADMSWPAAFAKYSTLMGHPASYR